MKNIMMVACLTMAGPLMAGDAKSFYAGGTKADGSVPTVTYTLKDGETLFHVAERLLGTPYAAEQLAKLNGITDPLRVSPGTKIQVPAVTKLSIIYSLERFENGDLVQQDLVEPMHAGDRFFVRVAANMPGYLYAFNRQANGEINRIFPSGNRNVRIQQFTEYVLPGSGAFQLDSQRGDEELWILVSSSKLDDLEAAVAGSEAVSDEAGQRVQRYMKTGSAAKGIRIADPDEDEDGTVVSVTGSGDNLVLVHQIPIRRH